MSKRARLAACVLVLSAALLGGAMPATAEDTGGTAAAKSCEAQVYDVATVQDARLFSTIGECRSHIAHGGAVTPITGEHPHLPGVVSVLWVAGAECVDEANEALGQPAFRVRWSPTGYAPFTHYPIGYSNMPEYERTIWRDALRPLLLSGCIQMFWTGGGVGAYDRMLTLGVVPEIWLEE